MDWESKFSSIVRETESNLAKVKQKLGSARASSHAALVLNGTDYTSNLSKTFSNSLPTPRHASYGMSDLNHSYSGPGLSSSHEPVINGMDHLSLENSPGIIMLLQDKVDTQYKMIEKLAKSVKRLEEEREHYFKQMREVREELALVNTRMAEKGVDLQTERKIEQWRREMMSEMIVMQSQISMHRSKDDDYGIQASQGAALLRDITEMKRWLQDECDSVRREIDTVKSRLVKVEISISAAEAENRDLNRKHERIEKNMKDIAHSHTATSRQYSRNRGDQDNDRMQITELRNSMRSIRDKLGIIESQIHEPKNKQAKSNENTRQKKQETGRRKKNNDEFDELLSPMSSDLDLSDTADLADLQSSEFSFSPKAKLKPASDDDLDLDDLGLTTDDLVSSALDTDDFQWS